MLIQLSDTVHVDPTTVTGIVRNRSESAHLRGCRLYIHDGRTMTVDREPADVLNDVCEAIGSASAFIVLGAEAFFKASAILAVTANRNPRSYGAGRPTRLYIGYPGSGFRSRTVTVSGSLQEVVDIVQAAQNPAGSAI